MGFVDGRVFWEPQMPGSNPAERAAVYDAMNATIRALHCSIGAHRPRRFRQRENYVARQVERWSKQYRASETQRSTRWSADRLAAKTCANQPARRAGHGDYRSTTSSSRRTRRR